MVAAIDLTGQRFGKLVALRLVEPNRFGARQWLCQCDCGGQTIALTGHLRIGQRRACKCGMSQPKHGEHKTRLYRIWGAMKARCYRPSHPRYERYGGRGISVCDEWLNDYVAFSRWARANGYADHLQIDREKNNEGYSPGNCRWTTAAVNMTNRECSSRSQSPPQGA
jgi:hypothetical protein